VITQLEFVDGKEPQSTGPDMEGIFCGRVVAERAHDASSVEDAPFEVQALPFAAPFYRPPVNESARFPDVAVKEELPFAYTLRTSSYDPPAVLSGRSGGEEPSADGGTQKQGPTIDKTYLDGTYVADVYQDTFTD